MSRYKYKDSIKIDIEETPALEDGYAVRAWEELDEVYAKAQAFDEIYKEFREADHDEYSFTEFVIDLVKRYESGDHPC